MQKLRHHTALNLGPISPGQCRIHIEGYGLICIPAARSSLAIWLFDNLACMTITKNHNINHLLQAGANVNVGDVLHGQWRNSIRHDHVVQQLREVGRCRTSMKQ